MLNKFDEWIHNHLGSNVWGDGHSSPPGEGISIDLIQQPDTKNYRFGHHATVGNDGYDLMFCYTEGGQVGDKWLLTLRKEQAFKLALWIIFRWWICSDWFGLRRWIWYASLHRVVQRYQFNPRPPREDDGD